MAFINGKEILFSSEINLTVVDVTQETGESKTAVMSQKSVTEELIKRDNDISRTNKRIENLEERISPSMFKTDSDVAYIKDVPANACPYAEVTKIGGMTRKTENLIPYPYSFRGTEVNGIKTTHNQDRSLTLKGTATKDAYMFFCHNCNESMLPSGTYYISMAKSGTTDVVTSNVECLLGSTYVKHLLTGNGSFTLDYNGYDNVRIYALVRSGKEVDETVRPMLNAGDTAKPYSEWFEGLRDTKVTAIKSIGANLIPYPYAEPERTIKGITFTDNGDGTVTANGTATGSVYFKFAGGMAGHGVPIPNWLEVGKTYTLFQPSSNSSSCCEIYFYTKDGASTKFSSAWSGTFSVPEGHDYFGIFGYIANGATVSNYIFKPMLTRGDTALPYAPYKERTFAIPTYVQTLPEYGEGVNETYHNYIDFERKVFVQRTKRKVLDGTEGWMLGGTTTSGAYRMEYISTDILKNADTSATDIIKAVGYESVAAGSAGTYGNVRGISTYGGYVQIYDASYSDVASWKAHLAELYAKGTPLTVEYALAEPIETPISSYLTDEFIEVEGNGILKFENVEALAVPSEISYMLKGATE